MQPAHAKAIQQNPKGKKWQKKTPEELIQYAIDNPDQKKQQDVAPVQRNDNPDLETEVSNDNQIIDEMVKEQIKTEPKSLEKSKESKSSNKNKSESK